MLNQPTIEKLQAMKLHGMAEAFQEQIEIPESSELSFEERLGLLANEASPQTDELYSFECVTS